jgi:hypothetical protein
VPLHALAEHIAVEIKGLADSCGYIDVSTEAVNETLSPGAWKLEIVTQFSSGSFFRKDPGSLKVHSSSPSRNPILN